MTRRQWVAVSVDVFDSDLGVDLRDEFGPVGLCMWVGFLTACKRNTVPGKIRYSSDAECLSLMGLPALELVDESGEPFKLDDFWSYLGQRKQTRVTRRKRLVDVTCTRWGRWQKSAAKESEAERKSSVRGTSSRTEPGHDPDENRTDRDRDKDRDTEKAKPPDLTAEFAQFWDVYPRREKRAYAEKAFAKAVKSAGSAEVVIDGARRYAENITARRVEKEFVAHPTSWLNAERWDDELPEPEDEGVQFR